MSLTVCECQFPNPDFSWDDHDHSPDEGMMHGCGSDEHCECSNTFEISVDKTNAHGDRIERSAEVCDDCLNGRHDFRQIPCDD